MRRWIFSEVKLALANAGMPDVPVLEPSSLGLGDSASPARPFVVLRSGLRASEPIPGLRDKMSRWPYMVWAHDDPGSYLRVDQMLEAVRGRLGSLSYPITAETDGLRILEMIWNDDSEDLQDDGFKTAVRWSSYTAMTRKLEV